MKTLEGSSAVLLDNKDEISHEDWLELRRGSIGASEVAAILGLSKWITPLSVWFSKVEGSGEEQAIPAEVGLLLEPWLLTKLPVWLKQNEGVDASVLREPHMLQHPKIPYLTCNLDGKINHPERGWGVVEAKTAGEFKANEWGEGELPDAYYCQTQAQMAVTGWSYTYVVALIGNRKIEVRYVPRNQAFIDRLVAEATAFWENYVLTKEPPAPVGEDIDTEILKLIYEAEEAEKVVDLSHMQPEYDRYQALNEAYKDAEKGLKELKQLFMAAMGDAEVAMVGEHKITWKTVEKKGYEVKPSVSRQLRVW